MHCPDCEAPMGADDTTCKDCGYVGPPEDAEGEISYEPAAQQAPRGGQVGPQYRGAGAQSSGLSVRKDKAPLRADRAGDDTRRDRDKAPMAGGSAVTPPSSGISINRDLPEAELGTPPSQTGFRKNATGPGRPLPRGSAPPSNTKGILIGFGVVVVLLLVLGGGAAVLSAQPGGIRGVLARLTLPQHLATLEALPAQQEEFRAGRHVDQDGDGKGEYGTGVQLMEANPSLNLRPLQDGSLGWTLEIHLPRSKNAREKQWWAFMKPTDPSKPWLYIDEDRILRRGDKVTRTPSRRTGRNWTATTSDLLLDDLKSGTAAASP